MSSFAPPGRNLADLTLDGTHFWVARGDAGPDPDRLYELDTVEMVVSEFECPGTSPGGLTYDGQHLWVVDMVTGRVYRIPKAGDYFLPYPDFEFGHLAGKGSELRGTDDASRMIRGFNSAGVTGASYAYPCDDLGGIAHDGMSLWVAEGEWFALAARHMLDASGAITRLAVLSWRCLSPAASPGQSPTSG